MNTLTDRPVEGYQGWANKETWTVHLHLGNTEWMYRRAVEIANTKYERPWDGADVLKRIVSDWLSYMVPTFPEVPGRDPKDISILAGDLISNALAKVEWHQVLVAFVDEDPNNA